MLGLSRNGGPAVRQDRARDKVIGPRLRIPTKFKDDEKNTRTETALMMQVDAIHGVHLAPGVRIRYAAADTKRQTIPRVEYANTKTGVTRTYRAPDAPDAKADSLPVFDMQCVDCHNRPAHAFETPDRAVDNAMTQGPISSALPFAKKTSVALLQATYGTEEEAAQKIPAALFSIYQRNVFPDLKVTWGTYRDNLGHTAASECFRCHDNDHATTDKKTITQDCAHCHKVRAVEESSPAILKTLGIQQKRRLAKCIRLRKQRRY